MTSRLIGVAFATALVAMAQTAPVPLPTIERKGAQARMLVDGKPYLTLAGELHNSSASNAEYMRGIWDKLAALHLNTVISTVSWELVEPEEGRFDFTTVDYQITEAHKRGMRLVPIWFGSWKNASSSYVPMWVKRDGKRFPMAWGRKEKGALAVTPNDALSSLGEASLAADAKAFRALMHHIRTVDAHHTVIMMQVENETGLLGDSRDRSPLAEEAWKQQVPAELMRYLEAHKATLLDELARVWNAHGNKTLGTWSEVFGNDASAEEIFMAWNVGRYTGRVAEAGKAELAIPMYANAWLGPQPSQDLPGQYPSGGPVTGMLDVWRAAAPKLDLFAPDIYVADFAGVCAGYTRAGNPLFIPEALSSAPNLFWAIGHHAALGYSPFGVEDLAGSKPFAAAYEMLGGLAPVLLEARTRDGVFAVLEGNAESVKTFEQATGLALQFTRAPKSDAAKDLPPFPAPGEEFIVPPDTDARGFALVVKLGADEFVIAGKGVMVKNARARLGTVDEGRYVAGKWVVGRRLNGDETSADTLFVLGRASLAMRRVLTYTAQ